VAEVEPVMGEATTPADRTPAWYLRSLADHDTHRGWLGGDGAVLALCGASFTPKPTLRVVGAPPGRLVDGPPELVLPRSRSRCARIAGVVVSGECRRQASRRSAALPLAPILSSGCGSGAVLAGY
jgi:hypothetical protein